MSDLTPTTKTPDFAEITRLIESARQRIESISLKADGKAELAAFEPGRDEPAAPAEDKSRPAVRRRPASRPETEDGGDEIRLF